MVEKICDFLTEKIRKSMPEINDERAEVINFGLQNIVGEIPKIFLVIAISFVLGIGKLTLLTFAIIIPYRSCAGGFHAKTHIGCIITTTLLYCGPAFLSKFIIFEPIYLKYIVIGLVWIFGMIMIKEYAPADTENVPILRKKERKQKQILSYIIFSLTLLIAVFVPSSIISNIIIIGMFIETVTITKLAYKLSNNKYGYEVYQN